jgi:hypothetical protein
MRIVYCDAPAAGSSAFGRDLKRRAMKLTTSPLPEKGRAGPKTESWSELVK